MSKFITIKGPSLNRILKKIEKKDFAMIKTGLRESSIFVKKEAQDLAPVVTGQFRRSIRRQVKGQLKRGFAETKIGVIFQSPAFAYAAKVEGKHKLFRQLEATKPTPVRTIFIRAINDFWKKQRIK